MPISSSNQVSSKLHALVKAVTHLSRRVQATAECQRVGWASSSPSPSTSHPRRMAKHQETQNQTQDMAQEVHRGVAKCMRELPSYNEAMSENDSTSEEEEQLIHQKNNRALKSGMYRTGVRKVTWPHEVVYTAEGKQHHIRIYLCLCFFRGTSSPWIPRIVV